VIGHGGVFITLAIEVGENADPVARCALSTTGRRLGYAASRVEGPT
jgi:hypothetical protein